MHVADDVERPGQVLAVVEQPLVRDLSGIDVGRPTQHVDPAEALLGQPAQTSAQIPVLAGDHGPSEVPVRPDLGALPAQLLGDVEHDGDGEHVVRTGHAHERGAGVLLHVGGIDHGQPAGGQPQPGHVVEGVERGRRRRLVVLVIGDHAAERIGGEHLRRREVLADEGGLARPGHSDQDHQAQVGDVQDAHADPRGLATAGLAGARSSRFADPRVNTASWVGVPTSRSCSPTPTIRIR